MRARSAAQSSPQSTGTAPSILSCAVILITIKLSLLTRGLRRTLRSLTTCTAQYGLRSAPPFDLLTSTTRHVATAAAFLPARALCLEQSLALYYCLRRAGFPARVVFGVKPIPFKAHAWVESGGVPINEHADVIRHFAVLPDIPE